MRLAAERVEGAPEWHIVGEDALPVCGILGSLGHGLIGAVTYDGATAVSLAMFEDRPVFDAAFDLCDSCREDLWKAPAFKTSIHTPPIDTGKTHPRRSEP